MHIELIEVMEYTQNKRGSTPTRPFDALSFRLQGESRLITEDRSVSAGAGDLLIAPKGITYDHIAKDERLIVFHFNRYDGAFDGIKVFTPKDPVPYKSLFTQALECWKQKQAGYHHKALSLFYLILSEMEREGLLQLAEPDPLMAQCIEYICAHLEDADLTVEALAVRCYMSETYFRRRFRKATGHSPKEFIINRRMKHAEILLRLGHHSQSEIAEMCGYKDVKFFREAFRRHHGAPITKFIKNFDPQEST